jgi:hypothetical protein
MQNLIGNEWKLGVKNTLFIILLYTLSGWNFFNIFGIRELLQAPLMLVMIWMLVKGNYYRLIENKTICILIFLISYLTLLAIAKSFDFFLIYGLIFSLFGIVIIGTISDDSVVKFSRIILIISVIAATTSLLLFFAILLSPDLKDLFLYEKSLEIAPFFSRPWLIFGSVMYETYEVGMFIIPRVKSFVNEPSSLLAYFYFPLAFSLLFQHKKSFLVILAFLALSLSGSVYSFFLLLPIIYLLFAISKKINSSLYPMGLLSSSLVILLCVAFNFDRYDLQIKDFDITTLSKPDDEGFSEGFAFKRTWSALIRLSSISSAMHEVFSSPMFGSDFYTQVPFGYILYSSFVAGAGGFLLVTMVFIKTYELIRKRMISCNSHREFFSMLFFSSYFFIAFLYNDYGFSSPYGMIIFALAIRLIPMKLKQCAA